MLDTAKVFTSGNSQAVRLPKAFRVDTTEMWISKNEATGEITLKPKGGTARAQRLDELFKLLRENAFTEDFIPERNDRESPNPLEEWAEQPPRKA
jgi:antitoxin VapB